MPLWPCSAHLCGCALHTYNEETSTNHHCLDPHVKIHRDLDPEVGGVGEDVVDKSRPILGDFANCCHLIESFYLQKEKTGTDINVNKSSVHWWHLHRINDCVLTCRVCYSCQILLLLLLLRCSISVKFPFTSGTQERVSSLETSASLELTKKWEKAIVKIYASFAFLSQCCVFFFLSHDFYSLLATLLWTTVPTGDRYILNNVDISMFLTIFWNFRQYPLESSDLANELTSWKTQKIPLWFLTKAKQGFFKYLPFSRSSEKFIQSSKTFTLLMLVQNIPQSQHLRNSHRLHMGQLFLAHLLYFDSV